MSVRETPIFIRKKGLKMKKKLLLLGLFPLLASSLVGCNKKADYHVGIIQWVQHPALDKATRGFRDGLKAAMPGKTIDFDNKNCSEDSSAASAIVDTFIARNKNLIMANATPAVQVAGNATATIPVVGTSVTSYEVAFGGTIPPHVTGTSDLAPLDQQAAELLKWAPDATKIGIFYCSGEPNSVYQSTEIQKEFRAIGQEIGRTFQFTELTFSETNEIQSVLGNGLSGIDVLYIPTDNTCAKNVELIHTICSQANKLVFAGEEGICAGCGIATLTIDYYELGRITGQMAAEILKGKSPSEMPIRKDENVRKLYNAEIAAELGITEIPEGYIAL